jgi:Flp pilus assembly protein TadG
MRPKDEGAAVVDFVLVTVLLLMLFLLVLQVGILFHVRNVLIESAAEGATPTRPPMPAQHGPSR